MFTLLSTGYLAHKKAAHKLIWWFYKRTEFDQSFKVRIDKCYSYKGVFWQAMVSSITRSAAASCWWNVCQQKADNALPAQTTTLTWLKTSFWIRRMFQQLTELCTKLCMTVSVCNGYSYIFKLNFLNRYISQSRLLKLVQIALNK